MKTIHVVLDNLRMHKGKQVQAWLAKHPRFVFHHPPVHCSWMNQVEQWFSILQAETAADRRLRQQGAPGRAADGLHRASGIEIAHPFNWTSKSVAKVMAKCELTEITSADSQPLAA